MAVLGLVLFLLGFGLQRLAARVPAWVESAYSRGMFPHIARALHTVFGWVPFSLAEALVELLVFVTLAWLADTVRRIALQPPRRRWGAAWRRLSALVVVLGAAYLAFILLWGLNYGRRPLAESLGLQTRPSSVNELTDLCDDLIDRANSLRQQVREDSNGFMRLNGSIPDALRRASLGYERASALYPVLAGTHSPPKGVWVSKLWSYTGIGGVYFPFTGEANVNVAVPASSIPASAAHEMAHQRGFAREDEANYIAYLVDNLHPDADFRYSGTLSALVSAMNALYAQDPGRYKELAVRYSPGVRRDLEQLDAYWNAHEGTVSRTANHINDQYLKANMQAEGVGSYGRMVDLLLAEYRARQVGQPH
ncbi:MAG: DUF3810 domain-containing protein [Bacillota bacterium]